MPSRQERRKAERAAAKRAPAKAGAAAPAGGGGASAAAAPAAPANPGGDWSTQAEDATLLHQALGPDLLKQRATEGDPAAQYSQGHKLMGEAGMAAGERVLGAGGRSPKADVGFRTPPWYSALPNSLE